MATREFNAMPASNAVADGSKRRGKLGEHAQRARLKLQVPSWPRESSRPRRLALRLQPGEDRFSRQWPPRSDGAGELLLTASSEKVSRGRSAGRERHGKAQACAQYRASSRPLEVRFHVLDEMKKKQHIADGHA